MAALIDILSSHSVEARAAAVKAIREEHAPKKVASDFKGLMDRIVGAKQTEGILV